MTEEMERMVTEMLTQRLGMQGGEMGGTPGGDPIMAAVALSLMKRNRSRQDEGMGTIRRVAAIVGACPRCLGEDASCVVCAGKGQPGYGAPDKAALLEWITPPLRRLGLCVSARRRQPREHNPVGG